jgi:hypothetical protein
MIDLAIDPTTPNTLYATSHFFGSVVYKSTNGGGNWNPINNGLPIGPEFNSIVIDPTAPSTLYLGTSIGVYKSTDAGATWQPSTSIPTVLKRVRGQLVSQ